MDDEINPNIIKATQVSLGKYIKRPPLTDKLLKKPPFRFLHDIITSVLKSTGFFNGLFEDYELISDKVKDRENKILFLNKVIFVIGSTTGKTLTVKPSKIVAGQEPQKTNELLQSLAYALENKLSSDESVRLYKESNRPNEDKLKSSLKKVTEQKKLTSRSSEKLPKNDKPYNNTTEQKQNHNNKKKPLTKKSTVPIKPISVKDSDEEKQDTKSNFVVNNVIEEQLQKSAFIDSEINNSTDEDNAKISSNTNLIKTTNDIEETETLHNRANFNENLDLTQEIKNESVGAENSEHIIIDEDKNLANNDNISIIKKITEINSFQHDPKPLLEAEVDTKQNDNEIISAVENETKLINITNTNRPQSVRPSSSRPSAPRLKEKHESLVSTADNVIVGKVNIIAENITQEEEDGSSIVIVEDSEAIKEMKNEELLSSNQHGHLVQQILDAQKEFSEVTGKTKIEWQFGVKKSRDIVNQEIEQLRFNVQALSRVANPLGKLLDHVQEDVEVMRQELLQWTVGYEDASKLLIKQKAANDESLLPLHTKLKQLQIDVQEKRDKINDLKVIINKNNLRIEKLLASGNMQ